ncbi:hypothetical protein NQ317_001294 [Molorchus minor]|uniref:Secreted protein n=1 Tax=Molorchus minor TaxID=1323400 RepID=A0ABQ9JNG7_9CUCU|nr:hypothetical protein NQ317_001294 [Molorchus minor]
MEYLIIVLLKTVLLLLKGGLIGVVGHAPGSRFCNIRKGQNKHSLNTKIAQRSYAVYTASVPVFNMTLILKSCAVMTEILVHTSAIKQYKFILSQTTQFDIKFYLLFFIHTVSRGLHKINGRTCDI